MGKINILRVRHTIVVIWIWRSLGGKDFATEHSNKPLSERFDIFVNMIRSGYKCKPSGIALEEKTKTITISFTCKYGLMHLKKGISTSSISL